MYKGCRNPPRGEKKYHPIRHPHSLHPLLTVDFSTFSLSFQDTLRYTPYLSYTLINMKLTVLAALTSCLAVVSAYPIKGDVVNCRSGPGTKYAVKKTYKKGQDVKLTCQTAGESVNGVTLWDKTSDGCYVSDYYVKTGTSGYVAPKCPASGGGGGKTCGAPKSNAATVNLIAQFEGFRANVCKSFYLPLPGTTFRTGTDKLNRQGPRGIPNRRIRPSLHEEELRRGQVPHPSLPSQRQEAPRR